MIGADGASPNGIGNSGQSYVVFGSRSGFSSNLNLSTLNGTNGFKINGIAGNDGSGYSVSSAGDINGDGIDDLMIGAPFSGPNGISDSGQSYVVFGSRSAFTSNLNLSDLNGTNGFRINGIAANDRSGRSVSSAGDINGDGIDDLIIGAYRAGPNGISYSGQSYVVFGSRSGFSANLNLSTLNGTNGFRINGITASDGSGFSVSSAGDINGDGIDDLIIRARFADPNGTFSGQSYVVFGRAGIGASGTLELSQLSGSTTDGIDFNTTFTGTAITVVDTDLTLVDRNSPNLAGATVTINNLLDGVNETLSATTTGSITSSYSTTTGVLTLSGAGTVAQYQQVLRTITYNNTAAAPDRTPRTIEFIVDDGAANSNTSTLATTTLAFNAPTRTDFNSDGKSDILWRNTDGSIATWQMDGSVVTPKSVGTLTNDWQVAGTGDFNGDRTADILWRNDNGSIATWQLNNSVVTATPTIGTATTDWQVAGTGDFNGDGAADVLWRNDDGSVVQWQMNGGAVAVTAAIGTVTSDWKFGGTGDLNGDGKDDVLWHHDDGRVALWQMDSLTVNAVIVGTNTTDWKIAGNADFNGDGKADILWRNSVTGSVAQWQMNGSAIASTAVVGAATTDWQIIGTGDVNGDGKADILWRNTDGGVATWQMNGANVLSAGLTSIPTADPAWKIAAPIL